MGVYYCFGRKLRSQAHKWLSEYSPSPQEFVGRSGSQRPLEISRQVDFGQTAESEASETQIMMNISSGCLL